MKRLIGILFTAFLLGFPVYGQNLELTLENTAGNLHTLLTQEQQKQVTDLTLTGSMDDSDFYFIRDNLEKLKMLDIREADADTIPRKAFSFDVYRAGFKLYLPVNVKYIGDEALQIPKVVISGDFPKYGHGVFCGVQIEIAADNKYLKQYDNATYSFDGKILHLFNETYNGVYEIREGTEVVASRVFSYRIILQITFPASLKRIEEHVFEHSEASAFAGWPDHEPIFLNFLSTQPPVLAENVFSENEMFRTYFTLIIPEGTEEEYKQADEQWSLFRIIAHSGIDQQNRPVLQISRNGNMLCMESENEIAHVSVLNIQGYPVCSSNGDGNRIEIPVQPKGIYLLKITYENGTGETTKIVLN